MKKVMARASQDTCFEPSTWEHGEIHVVTIQGTIQNVMAELVLHLDAAHNLARWLVRNETDAEDVVQDAYVRAFRYLHTLRGGESRPWLMAIVRNACYDWLRRGRAAGESADEDIDRFETDTPDPETVLLRKSEAEALRDGLERLPSHLREVLVLREWERMPYKDIAGITGVPCGTVMSRLSRARQQLQQAFGSRLQIAGDSQVGLRQK
jgi:RNA polymerase sigma factor (sigma-70 family)